MAKDHRKPPRSPVKKPITRERITSNTGQRISGIMDIKPEIFKIVKKRMRDGHVLHQQYVIDK
jgi:hypothetical protein